MSKIVSIHSFRGGTGKSNTAANLAALMALRGSGRRRRHRYRLARHPRPFRHTGHGRAPLAQRLSAGSLRDRRGGA